MRETMREEVGSLCVQDGPFEWPLFNLLYWKVFAGYMVWLEELLGGYVMQVGERAPSKKRVQFNLYGMRFIPFFHSVTAVRKTVREWLEEV